MKARGLNSIHERSATATRVGLFGKLGAGNIGNDASMEAVLNFLRSEHPDAIVDAMCTGPETMRTRYGIDAVNMFWHHKYTRYQPGLTATALKVLGKGVDVVRTASWARRHEVVIVPGAGVLEASLPMLPRGFPYSMFLLCASGRVFGTKVALVSVGAGTVNQRLTRWLFNSAARLAFYRSYRDPGAREAMRRRGLDISDDNVYPDLAFALPAPPYDGGGDGDDIVCVGVMAYYGTNDERGRAEEIYSSYVAAMKRFVGWLVDSGRTVRLVVGDTNGSDEGVVEEILVDLRARRPDLDPSRAVAEPVSSFTDVMRVMLPARSVVAIRYHNLVCALKLCKPTISIGYSPKHDALMAEMGLPAYCQSVNSLDVDRLIEQFTDLESRSAQLRQTMKERNSTNVHLLEQQFDALSTALFESRGGSPADGHGRATMPEMLLTNPAGGKDIIRADSPGNTAKYYKRDYWSEENLKFSQPWYRIEKAARIIEKIASGEERTLLDVGCGPAALGQLLPPNIKYFGIDIAIHHPSPNLLEADLLEMPIHFDGRHFDIVVAQGFFEYVGDLESEKFAEIARLLNKGGTFIVSYTNFSHRSKRIYSSFSNIRPLDDFQMDLARYFNIEDCFPASHNWKHSQPSRKLNRAINMHVSSNIPFVSKTLAVEYFFLCSSREA